MAFDGGMVRKITYELKTAVESRIEKLYQPSGDELVILLRKKGFAERLYICVRSGAARIHFTDERPENPETPPMFCMLLRKHFTSAKLTDVAQKGFERIVILSFEAVNEMGDRVNLKIICELIGNQSNVILLNGEGRIIDALKRSDIQAKRLILPGAVYEYPEPQQKLDITCENAETVAEKIIGYGEEPLWRGILNVIDGVSPLIAREMAYRMGAEDNLCQNAEKGKLISEIEHIKGEILSGGSPVMLKSADNTPADFSYIPIGQYGALYESAEYPSFCELLDNFYRTREIAARMKRMSSDIAKLVSNLINRAKKRKETRKMELSACCDREKLRIYGELIKANIYAIAPGSKEARVQNFYDENLKEISIPLDPAISASKNADRYFKEYKKSYTAEQTLTALIEKDTEEIEYLETVSESLNRCTSSSDISEIREELTVGGYIKGNNGGKSKKNKAIALKEYTSPEGYKILVGKNNTQNDYITTRLSSKSDLWFHTKGIHGSHVVVMCGGEEVSEETILFAARLAAKNSKAANSSNVPVDYTPVKYVKKPAGAKPGMVIYTTNKTVFVTPEGNYD